MRPEDIAMILGVAAGGAFLLSPVMIVRMFIQHRERLAAMKNRQEGAPAVVQELAALREELAQLREATTHYDLSFDAALTRVESRLHTLEDEKRTTTRSNAFSHTVITQEPETLHARR